MTGRLGAVIAVALTVGAACADAQALNAELATAAWDAFNARDLSVAIARAESCISTFKDAADAEQGSLTASNTPLPPTGEVTADVRERILARGLLNDVATCLYIKARAAEDLGRRQDAREAYQLTLRYPHARCWDPKGFFWSPTEAARERLQKPE
jgi:hypothetical protein